MISLDYSLSAVGVMLAFVALSPPDRSNPRRYTTGLFWALYAAVYLAGEAHAAGAGGRSMIAMALMAGFGGVAHGKARRAARSERRASAARLGNRLFIPALVIPVVTMIGSTLLKDVQMGGLFLLDQKHLTLVSLGCGAVIARGGGLLADAFHAAAGDARGAPPGRRDGLGGGAAAHAGGAGPAVHRGRRGQGGGARHDLLYPMDSQLVAVAVYCIGMALFTIVMGNGFAAFPVMTGGVGVPVLVGVYGANPAVMAAIGMFSGLLRHADDADGGQLQHRAGGAAGTARQATP